MKSVGSVPRSGETSLKAAIVPHDLPIKTMAMEQISANKCMIICKKSYKYRHPNEILMKESTSANLASIYCPIIRLAVFAEEDNSGVLAP